MIVHPFAKVYVDIIHEELDKPFDYAIPISLQGKIQVGTRVLIPFGKQNKLIEGYVVKLNNEPDCDLKYVKSIKEVLDSEPIFSYTMLKLAYWMKKEYMCTFVEVLQCMMPTGIKTKYIAYVSLKNKNLVDESILRIKKDENIKDIISYLEEKQEIPLEQLMNEFGNEIEKEVLYLKKNNILRIIKKPFQKNMIKTLDYVYLMKGETETALYLEQIKRRKAFSQIKVLEFLLINKEFCLIDLKKILNISHSTIKSLEAKNVIGIRKVDIRRSIDNNREYESSSFIKLTEEQQKVYNKALKYIREDKSKPILLHGITGSGKTEIYMYLIKDIMNMGKQAIFLVPEIALTPQMIYRFKSKFGDKVAVMHSKLSLGEQYDQWSLIREGKVSIAIGARSAIFSPFSKLGIIIIDEEHESSYKSESKPKYNTIEVAKKRAEMEQIPLILGSATPSLETYFQVQRHELNLLEILTRVDHKTLPKVKTIDMRMELANGNKSILSEYLYNEIKDNIKNNKQIILFLNRRGYSTFVSCRKCGYVAKCLTCDISLTYHKVGHKLKCHYCEYQIDYPRKCPICNEEKYVKHFGTGTQKIELEIQRLFPKVAILRMDVDTTTKKNAHGKIIEAFQKGKADILIGTQMVAKGLDFPNVTLVGVISADISLHIDDFRAAERTFQLLTQVAGRAGRGNEEGRVVIQTYNPEHYSILHAQNHNFHGFYEEEIKIRKFLNYPPFTNLCSIVISGEEEKEVISGAYRFKEYVMFYNMKNKLEVLGPTPSILSKIKNKYRWKLIIKCNEKKYLIMFIKKCLSIFNQKEKNTRIQISTDINPFSIY